MTHRPDQATGPDGTFTWLGLSAMCTSKRWGRVERYDALHPEKPWFDTEGRGFDSRHLHVMGPARWTSSTEQGPCFCRGNDPPCPRCALACARARGFVVAGAVCPLLIRCLLGWRPARTDSVRFSPSACCRSVRVRGC